LIYTKRNNRTPAKEIWLWIIFVLSCLFYRETAKALSIKIYQNNPCLYLDIDTEIQIRKIPYKRRTIPEFVVDETQIKVDNDYYF
jgi:hypothetical protein